MYLHLCSKHIHFVLRISQSWRPLFCANGAIFFRDARVDPMESAKVLMSLWLILSLLDLNIIDIISVGNHHIMKKYSLLHNLGDIS